MVSCDLNVLVGGVGHEVRVGGHDHACAAVGKVAQVSNNPQGVVVIERAGGFVGEHYLGPLSSHTCRRSYPASPTWSSA